MKSNKYWWSRLSHKQKKQVRQNTILNLKLILKFRNRRFLDFLSGLFVWDHSNQGADYWQKISKKNIK